MKKVLKTIGIVLLVSAILFNSYHISSVYDRIGRLVSLISKTNENVTSIITLLGTVTTITNGLIDNQHKFKLIVGYLLDNLNPKPDFKSLKLSTVEVKVGRAGGAGNIIDQDEEYLYIISARHVIDADRKGKIQVKVTNTNNEKFIIKVPRKDVKVDRLVDVGLIKVKKPKGEFKSLSLCKESPGVGTKIYTIGHPIGFHYTVNVGIVSNYVKRKWMDGHEMYMLISAPSFSGNSGGATINCNNELVGIVVGVMYVGKKSKPMYLYHLTIATNLEHISRFLDELKDEKEIKNGTQEEKVK